jgi:hypothetical protein
MMKSIIFCLGLLFVSATSFVAQELTGFVKDKKQNGIPYVNIGIPAKPLELLPMITALLNLK